jgi:PAP2 superfamily protein
MSAVPGARTVKVMVIARRIPESLRQLGIFALAYGFYFGVRSITEGPPTAAFRHALDVVKLERSLGIDWERSVQDQILGSRLLTDVANAVYMYGHWPVIIVTGVLLFHYRRSHYYQLRNVCLLSGLVGLVIFALFPVAPPRLTDMPLVDTITKDADGYRQLVPSSLVNEYAAFPSFHAGWNVLLGIVVFRATHSRLLRALAVVGPTAMVVAVVATANHFVIDVVAGVVIVLAGLFALHVVQRRRSCTAPDRTLPLAVRHGRRAESPPAGTRLTRDRLCSAAPRIRSRRSS